MISEIKQSLRALLEDYSRLLASMQTYSIRDFSILKIQPIPIKLLFQIFGNLIHTPESRILEYSSNNRSHALKHVRGFCDDLIEKLDDIERARQTDFKSVETIRSMVVDFRNGVPQPPKGITIGQIGSLIAIVAAIVSAVVEVSRPNEVIVISLIFSLGRELGWIALALWSLIWGYVFGSEYLWYRIMLRHFGIKKKELAFYKSLRPLTKKFSTWVYSQDP